MVFCVELGSCHSKHSLSNITEALDPNLTAGILDLNFEVIGWHGIFERLLAVEALVLRAIIHDFPFADLAGEVEHWAIHRVHRDFYPSYHAVNSTVKGSSREYTTVNLCKRLKFANHESFCTRTYVTLRQTSYLTLEILKGEATAKSGQLLRPLV